jgi:alpha-glucosidase
MKFLFIALFTAAYITAPSCLAAQAAIPLLSSPDGLLEIRFAVESSAGATEKEGGQLTYSVRYRGKPVIDASPMGLELDLQAPLGKSVRLNNALAGSGIDDYALANTKVSHVHDAYRSLTLKVTETGGSGRTLIVEARAYDNGVAFRYVVPRQSGVNGLHLRGESTEFHFSEDDPVWALALPGYRSSYESEYVPLQLSSLSNQGGVASHFLIGMPLLLHQPGVAWMALMESDLEGSSAMYVTNPTGSWTGHSLSVLLSPRWDEPREAVRGELPYHSAWRILAVGDTPGALLEANLLTNLSPDSRVADTSWIKPGKASWNWWTDNVDNEGHAGNKNFNTATMKQYVDFAADSGFPYFFLDAGWSTGDITKMNGTVDVPELVRYAATKNVKVWIWLYSESVMRQMKEAFPLYEKWGVAGLKIDFVNRNDQEGIQFFYNTAEYAAAHHLMVDFHGCQTPWGMLRTYPNVMSYEAVLGLENNKAGRRDTPQGRTTFAFTRALAGPFDYTAGAFDNATEAQFVVHNSAPMAMGTRAHQLALYVVFENPIPMVSDSPQHYRGEAAFEFLREVPAAWDETRVLDGAPGEFATVARRHGNEWYVGSITNWTARTIEVPLTFLGAGAYIAELYADGSDAATNPKQVEISRKQVTAGNVLKMKLAPGGGAAVRIVPAGGK